MALRSLLILYCCQVLLAARVMPRAVTRHNDQAGLASDTEADGCSKLLVVDFSESTSFGSKVWSLKDTGAWAYSAWQDVDVLEKSTETCHTSYKAQCKKSGVTVTTSCEGDDESELGIKCLTGPLSKPCFKLYRQTDMELGDKEMILKVPTSKKGFCDFKMSAGTVKYWAVSEKIVFAPDAYELANIALAAANMNNSNDECGPVAMSIRENVKSAATILRDLALNRSASADNNKNTEEQTLHNLLALHFHHRTKLFNRGVYGTLSTRNAITKLDGDLQWIKKAKEAKEEETFLRYFNRMSGSTSHGLQALAYYSQSLRKFPPPNSENGGGRKALIFTCSFGGGHKSAAKAVSDALASDGYEAIVMDTTYDDHFADKKNMKAAEYFNEWIIGGQNYALFNVFDKMQQALGPLNKPCPSPKCDTDRKQRFRTAVLKHRPDIVVTVYHMELVPVLEVAKELGNLPVLHIATDIDIKMPELFTEHFFPIYPRLRVGVPFELEESYNTIAPLSKAQTFLSGYPVRAAFLKPFDKQRVMNAKSQFIPQGTKLMVVMTGGGGQDVTKWKWWWEFIENGIGDIGAPLHIVIIAGGRNEVHDNLKAKMAGEKTFGGEGLEFGERTVMHATDDRLTVEVATDPENTKKDKPYYILENRMTLLLDMADVVMAKPGGGSTAEIAYRGTPAIFDLSVTLFHWEEFTVKVFEKEGRGARFTSEADLRSAIISATAMQRSTKIAEDPEGKLLDTSARVITAANSLLLETTCAGCEVFNETTLYDRAKGAMSDGLKTFADVAKGAVTFDEGVVDAMGA